MNSRTAKKLSKKAEELSMALLKEHLSDQEADIKALLDEEFGPSGSEWLTVERNDSACHKGPES